MVSLADIRAAAELIRGHVLHTPLVYSPTISSLSGAEVYLKLETLQLAGSFKARGATARILGKREEIGDLGVVTASAGNHAQGVAVAAREAGIPATIVMPSWASIAKQEAVRGYGAAVILEGASLEESLRHARTLAAEGRTLIHPYDDPLVVAGQGTIGLEILEDLPDTDCIIAPVGGGGLIAGIATAVKGLHRDARVIGVQAAACPSAVAALAAGKVVRVAAQRTLADGIRVQEVGASVFPVLRDVVDSIVLVDEEEITAAMILLLERKRIIAEGAGATPLAALMGGKVQVRRGETVVLVVSGGNVDTFLLERVLRYGMRRSGRILRVTVTVEDSPGSLARLIGVIASQGGNILQVNHIRAEPGIPLQDIQVSIDVEVRGSTHGDEMHQALTGQGYDTVVH
jgi:threonine dehydratase